MDDAEVRERVAQVEQLLDGLDERGERAVAAVVELYGEALRRIVSGASLTKDELVAHLLLLHGLHPAGVRERVAQALEELRGGELVELSGTVARVRLASGCRRATVEEAVLRVAPELERVEIVSEPKLLQIGSLR
jgi:hypothetical protein